MGSNGPSKLERSLSLTSEPRTLTKKQYDMAIASMQAMEKQQRPAGTNKLEEQREKLIVMKGSPVRRRRSFRRET